MDAKIPQELIQLVMVAHGTHITLMHVVLMTMKTSQLLLTVVLAKQLQMTSCSVLISIVRLLTPIRAT